MALEFELISWLLRSCLLSRLDLVALAVDHLVPVSVAPLGERI